MKKSIGIILGAVVVLAALIQFIPYGHNHTDPPVVHEISWSTPEARQIAVRACFDCHSNQTVWYWYTNIAPFSWLVQRDVDEGRRRLNFSDFQGNTRGLREINEVIQEGRMPPLQYTLIHPTAKLSEAEKQVLIDSLVKARSASTP